MEKENQDNIQHEDGNIVIICEGGTIQSLDEPGQKTYYQSNEIGG